MGNSQEEPGTDRSALVQNASSVFSEAVKTQLAIARLYGVEVMLATRSAHEPDPRVVLSDLDSDQAVELIAALVVAVAETPFYAKSDNPTLNRQRLLQLVRDCYNKTGRWADAQG